MVNCGSSCKKLNSGFQFQFQFQFQGFQFQFHFQFHPFQFQFQFRNWNWNWYAIPIPELNWPQPWNILVDISFVSMKRREICWMRNGIHEHRSIYDDGIVRRQFQSMRPLCRSQMGNLICFLHKITTIIRFQCNHISIFLWFFWYHVIIRIKTRSTMHSGTCLTVWQITRPSVSEFDFLWVTCPSALSRQNPTGAVSIPQVIFNKS